MLYSTSHLAELCFFLLCGVVSECHCEKRLQTLFWERFAQAVIELGHNAFKGCCPNDGLEST